MKQCQVSLKFKICGNAATHTYLTVSGHKRFACSRCAEAMKARNPKARVTPMTEAA